MNSLWIKIGASEKLGEEEIAGFIEKPPSKGLPEALEIELIIEKSGIINSVWFYVRFTGTVEKTKDLKKNEKIPLIRSIFVCLPCN